MPFLRAGGGSRVRAAPGTNPQSVPNYCKAWGKKQMKAQGPHFFFFQPAPRIEFHPEHQTAVPQAQAHIGVVHPQ